MLNRGVIIAISVISLLGAAQTCGKLVADTAAEPESAYLTSEANVRDDQPIGSAVSIDRAQDGLFHVSAQINGIPIDMAVDTGATRTIVAPADALKIGLVPNAGTYSNMETLNGQVRLSRIKIDELLFGNTKMRNMEIVLGPQTLNQSIVGLDALSRSGPVLVDGHRLTFLAPKNRAASEQT